MHILVLPDFRLIIVLLFKVTLLLFLRRRDLRMERTKLFSYFIFVDFVLIYACNENINIYLNFHSYRYVEVLRDRGTLYYRFSSN